MDQHLDFFSHSVLKSFFRLNSLSSDLLRLIGHAVCLESTALNHVQNFLAQEPLSRMLSGGDVSKIPLYRWRHIRVSGECWDLRELLFLGCSGRFGLMDHDDLLFIRIIP